jgi:hypothetical protein
MFVLADNFYIAHLARRVFRELLELLGKRRNA